MNNSMKQRKNDGDAEDRFSNLSDHILHHILSFVNIKKVVQTSGLSKRWRFLWCSLPFLKFDSDQYFSRKSSDSLTSFVDQGDDGDLVNNLFSSCSLLESLSIRSCEFRGNYLNISSLKLKHLRIERYHDNYDDFKRNTNGSVKVYNPNLISFRCKDFLLKRYTLGDFPSLVKADIDMAWEEGLALDMRKIMRAAQNVKALTLSGSVPQHFQLAPGKEKLLMKFREKLLTFPIASPRMAIVLD